ncbi:PAS domain-containing protein [Nocardia terpenica]
MADVCESAEERFRVVFDNSAMAISICDPVGILVDANPAWAQMNGVDVADSRGTVMDDQPSDR